MSARLTIGEFSKMTYLSVKALRHYHEVGLLAPAEIDPATGYRSYSTTQVSTAQAIRRFRELDMPIDQVRAVLHAPDLTTRNEAILAHLSRMQQQLERTQSTVASLQALLEDVPATASVEYRTLASTRALAITEQVAFDDAGRWCDEAFAELHSAWPGAGASAGPDGALYFSNFFENALGTVTAFVPIVGDVDPGRRMALLELPPIDVAVLHHDGPFDDLDKTYGALGTIVAERGIGVEGPIREHYLADDSTDVCWPIGAIPSSS